MVFVKVQADVLEYIGTGHGQDREYGGWHVFSCDEKLEDQGYFGKVVWTTWFSRILKRNHALSADVQLERQGSSVPNL